MARNSPVRICVIKQRPTIDPMFHQMDRLAGAGRSISLLFTILIRG